MFGPDKLGYEMDFGYRSTASLGEFNPFSASIPATKVELTISCRNLLDRDTFSKSDPCLLYTVNIGSKEYPEYGRTEVIDNTLNPDFVKKFIMDYFFEERQNLRFDLFTICHKTEVVKNTLNPVWQAFKIPVRALCNGDFDRTIKIEVYDWDRDGSHDYIGEFTTSYRELSRGQSQFNVYEVINPKKKGKKKKYLNSGTVTLLSFLVETEVSFLDYIKGGTQINFTVAIDFTASNGNPAQPTSLHYMNPYQLNAYGMALKAVGEIIQDYDSDKMFPALGFGAKLPPDGRVCHEFALVSFFFVLYATSVKDGSQYFVLLIITDGVISDMAQTKEAIVNASKLPMSIIIVGVGPAEFDAMVELDGDEVRVSSRGRYAERDIVQFVPFRDYIDRTGNHVLSMARLAKDVLAEIPDQFLLYMRSRGFKPFPAPPPYTPPGHLLQTQI
ncbi:copine-8 [Pyxicephalus adspersus]|uniref:copine-8 n=1 Tax=Pyxicephalus adspersus TaxID=30357 RepID=UPI003B5981B3